MTFLLFNQAFYPDVMATGQNLTEVAAALAGSRNYGQRFLEVAVVGYEKPEDARAALVRELEKVIKVEKTMDQAKR